ncbi:MAG: uracil-DNA glycosylase [Acidaminococcales bacterium]|nr:uracil-DNA glycosylase [Acidaminococcales bacterium]
MKIDAARALEALGQELKACSECELRAGCIAPVGWYGDAASPLVIVGEGPGRVEDEYGCPLIGPSGQLLDKALASVGVTRDRILTTNTVKCRPENNRTPTVAAAAFCADRWLSLELEIIRPAVVIALGSVALHYLGSPDKRITKERGQWFVGKSGASCITTYHPAYLLRLHGDSLKQAKWQVHYDLKAAVEKCAEARPDYVFASEPPPDLFALFPKRI